MPTSKPLFYEFITRKKFGVPLQNFVQKNVLCEKGEEITRFDGTLLAQHEPKSNISKNLPLRAGLPVPGGLDGLDQTQAITKLTGSEIEAFRKS
jgi:hypothetical protein